VAVLGAAPVASWNDDVREKILGVGTIAEVNVIPVTGSDPVPTLAQLSRYRAVLVYSDSTFNDSVALGDVLADYVDEGGGVAMATFAFWDSTTFGIQGRLKTGNYLPFTTAPNSSGNGLTLVKDLSAHPLLDGVNSLDGGIASYHESPIAIANGATLVASWSNGQPLVGAKEAAPGRVVGLNFYPPSSDVRNDFWVAATDGDRLMASALLWAGQTPPTVLTAPVDLVVFEGDTVSFTVTANGSATLGYQWKKDGADVPGAMSSNLVFTALASSSGKYRAVVSNPYGIAISTEATLTVKGIPPLLRFLVPEVATDGSLTLFLVNADSSPITPDRVSNIRIYTSPDVATPLSSWTLQFNPLVLTNGQLRIDGFNATNAASQFFRAVESP
jgi:hypothetical protein